DRGTTPATLAGIAAGTHALSIRLEGYDERQLETDVGASGTTTVAVNLTPSAPLMGRGSPSFLLVLAAILGGIAALIVAGAYFFMKR
ncbi:MAG TPA: PEGA domain-containing protein, partial [Methanomicrobiales archaeon]|nr:PEGA domain-containing protein [Methanomicrobiales archaeon]